MVQVLPRGSLLPVWQFAPCGAAGAFRVDQLMAHSPEIGVATEATEKPTEAGRSMELSFGKRHPAYCVAPSWEVTFRVESTDGCHLFSPTRLVACEGRSGTTQRASIFFFLFQFIAPHAVAFFRETRRVS